MASKPHTDDIYRPKRIPKNPIKFKLQLNDEQKEAKQMQLTKDLKKEVETGKNGTQKYVLKQGPNKGKVL